MLRKEGIRSGEAFWSALRRHGDALLAVLAIGVILALFLAAPGSLLDKADRAAYAVCHRIASHSFIIAGRPLPLCARCSGTYLGALAALVVLALRGRGRASRLPGRKYGSVLAGFLLLWAFDGLNSYLTLFPGLPYLYEPHNILRLATGSLVGVAITAFLLPVTNLTLWRSPAAEPAIASWRDLGWLVVGAAAVVVVVDGEWAPLLYPLALISGLMVIVLAGTVNAVVVLLFLHRDGRGTSWRSVAAPILAGAALAMTELAAVGLGRELLAQRLGLPF
ncbi:MAG TPA: DUF2085 domain-containing protein [Anaerolineae bacterium]